MKNIGRFFSKNANDIGLEHQSYFGSISMLFYFVALVVQVAEVDSATNNKEMECLYSFFPNFLNVKRKVDAIYHDALEEKLSTVFLTSKINKVFGVSEELYRNICLKLIEISDSDSPVNNLEFDLISQIAKDFGFAREDVEEMLENYIVKSGANDYEILNLDESASLKDINDSYRELAMKFHPDKLFSCDNIHRISMESYKKRYDMISNSYKNLKFASKNMYS